MYTALYCTVQPASMVVPSAGILVQCAGVGDGVRVLPQPSEAYLPLFLQISPSSQAEFRGHTGQHSLWLAYATLSVTKRNKENTETS